MASQPKTQSFIKAITSELPLDEMLDRVAEGATQAQLAALVSERLGKPVSQYYVSRWVNADPDRKEAWLAAKKQCADRYADVVAETIKDVKDGKLEANAAKVVSSNAQWLAARLDPGRWGDRVSVDVQTLDVTALHLEGLRQAMRNEDRQEELRSKVVSDQ